jgi:hypothetical protein
LGRRALILITASSLALSGCVSMRQVADPGFQPPQGDYSLIVMRPDVKVGQLTAGGLVEPRADWTEQARANVLAALQAQQAQRGGRTIIAESRESVPGVDPETMAGLERLHSAVGNSIVLHKYMGADLPTKRRGLDWTLGEEAVRFGQATGMDYALFLHAEDAVVTGDRVALQVLGIAGCFIGFCAPNIGGGSQLAYASLVDLRSGEVVWFNVLQAGSQIAGIQMGDLRTPQGATQMVDRLLGRMREGRDIRAGRQ